MTRPLGDDPYRTVIQWFNRRGIRYVVVGMAGINYYARHAGETFATMDYDFFLDPSLSNVARAVDTLKALGFTLGTAGGIVPGTDLQRIVRNRTTIVATTTDGLMVELLLEVSGYPFSELAKDAATVTVRGVPVKVGRLTKLLRSKKLADRPKDRQFLQRYHALLNEHPAPGTTSPRSKRTRDRH